MIRPKSRARSAVTIGEVAKHANVSIATVSRVLNQNVGVTDGTSARVLAAVAELGYVPQNAARNLAQGRTSMLGLVLPDASSDFYSPLLRGITESASAAGYDVLIAIQPNGDDSKPIRRSFGRHNADGLLAFDLSYTDTELRRLHAQHFPVVLMYRSPPSGTSIPTVIIENTRGARQIVDHLIEAHGCRRIAFLRGQAKNEDSAWREHGYREALAAHGLPYDPSLIGLGDYDEQTAYTTVTRWLAEGLAFEAIFAADDTSANGALAALTQGGRRVPHDIALAGFDDVLAARYLNPPLTTVHAPMREVGQAAVWQLIRLIETGDADRTTLLPTELVIRQSCGCP
jgi:DNA-binding LacI/PurR family transcriptional regulator